MKVNDVCCFKHVLRKGRHNVVMKFLVLKLRITRNMVDDKELVTHQWMKLVLDCVERKRYT